jgi:hypothetical protein
LDEANMSEQAVEENRWQLKEVPAGAPRSAGTVRRRVCSTTFALLATVGVLLAQTGAYTLNGGSAALSDQTFSATLTDQSAILVTGGGNLTLNNPTVTKTGGASNTNPAANMGSTPAGFPEPPSATSSEMGTRLPITPSSRPTAPWAVNHMPCATAGN